MENRRQSVGRRSSRTQSDAAAPEMQMVSVAVLPPKLPSVVAPPSGIAASGAIAWDERINYAQDEPVQRGELSKRKQYMRKVGLTTQRERLNKDLPPFTFKQVPYDTWRKHYAKDADGNYRGTHTPAQDCLLKPDDVRRWRFEEEPETEFDRWTRGSEALPGYSEAQQDGVVPAYQADYTGPPAGEPIVGGTTLSTIAAESTSSNIQRQPSSGQEIADGKTAEEIIAEAEAKNKARGKPGWKTLLKKGGEMAILGR